jgi:hypothetical protein
LKLALLTCVVLSWPPEGHNKPRISKVVTQHGGKSRLIVTAAIAKAAFYTTLTEELQRQVQDFDAFCGVACVHDDASRSRQGTQCITSRAAEHSPLA